MCVYFNISSLIDLADYHYSNSHSQTFTTCFCISVLLEVLLVTSLYINQFLSFLCLHRYIVYTINTI